MSQVTSDLRPLSRSQQVFPKLLDQAAIDAECNPSVAERLSRSVHHVAAGLGDAALSLGHAAARAERRALRALRHLLPA